MDWLLFKKTLAQKQAAAEQQTNRLVDALRRASDEATKSIESLEETATASAQLFAQSGNPEHAKAVRDDETTHQEVRAWHANKLAKLRSEFETARDESDRLRVELHVQNMRDAALASQEVGARELARCRSGLAELAKCITAAESVIAESCGLLRIEGEDAYSAAIDTYAANVIQETNDPLVAHRAREVLHARDGIPFQKDKLAALTVLLQLQFPLLAEPFGIETIAVLEMLINRSKDADSNAHARRGLHAMAVQQQTTAALEPSQERTRRLSQD